MRELMAMKAQGYRAVLLFAVLHTGIERVSAAAHIDPTYAELLHQAVEAGVEVLAYKANISAEEVVLNLSVPYALYKP